MVVLSTMRVSTLTEANSTFTNNIAIDGDGGAIYNQGFFN